MHDSSERENAPECHPNTRVAVKEHIMALAGYGGGDAAEKRIMWLSGPAGAGKTAIMGTVADELQAMGRLAGSFFFSSSSTIKELRSIGNFVTTLAYQLIQHKGFERFRDAVLLFIEKDTTIFGKNLKHQMEALILNPLRECRPQHDGFPDIFVLDGLDECQVIIHGQVSDDRRRSAQRVSEERQIEVLSVIVHAVKDPAFPFRVVIASRPEHYIERFLSSCGHCCNIFLGDNYRPDADITLFLNAKFSQMREDYSISPSWPGDAVTQQLVRNASGQFIYAATIVRFVETGQNTPQKQLEFVLDVPSGEYLDALGLLDTLYARVLRSSPNPVLALKWLKAYACLDNECFGPTKAWFWCRLCETAEGEAKFLFRSLSALLCISDLGIPHKASLSFYHKSFQDFLSDSRRYGKHFPKVEDKIVQRWLEERYNGIFEHRSPNVPLRHPYHHEVFLAVARIYGRAFSHGPTWTMVPQAYTRGDLDSPFQRGLETDIVFLLIGGQGGGISSIIRQFEGSIEMRADNFHPSESDEIVSTAVNQGPARYEALNEALGGRRVVFVNTPDLNFRSLASMKSSFARTVKWLEVSYGRSMVVGGVAYVQDIRSNKDLHPEVIQLFLKFLRHPALAMSQALLLTTQWDRIDGAQAKVERHLQFLAKPPEGLQTMIVHSQMSVHHLIGRYGPDLPTADLQDPWEVVQDVVTTMHARDITHRIRAMQDVWDSKSSFLRPSEAERAVHKPLQSLQARMKELQEQIGRDTLLEELHWEVIRLRANHPEFDPPAVVARATPTLFTRESLLAGPPPIPAGRSRIRRWLQWLRSIFCSGR